MRIIGLTGGIGSGKSTVSSYLAEKGYEIIDADEVARELTEPGGAMLSVLAEAFGDDILDEEGSLKRKELGARVFGIREKEKILNEITHSRISAEMRSRIEIIRNSGADTVFLDVPLLFEVGMDSWCDTVWLVTCDMNVRIRRVMNRDCIGEEQVKRRIESQMCEAEKAERADAILDNSFDKEGLYRQIDRLLEEYERC